MLYLHRYYRLLPIESALEELYAHGARSPVPKQPRQRTALVLTFDDGYRDNYTHAFALACELRVPLTLYLVPGYIESGEHFWWIEGRRLVERAGVRTVNVEGHVYTLDNPQERAALADTIDRRLRRAGSVPERERFLASMRAILEVSKTILEDERPSLPLQWEQVQEMAESGWVSFGAHTLHHPILAYLTDSCELQREVAESRHVLKQRLHRAIRTFAYPVGQRQHLNANVVQAVQQAGYDWALTTTYGLNTPEMNPYLLKRIEVDADQHWLVVAAEAAGLWGVFSRLRWQPMIRKYCTNAYED